MTCARWSLLYISLTSKAFSETIIAITLTDIQPKIIGAVMHFVQKFSTNIPWLLFWFSRGIFWESTLLPKLHGRINCLWRIQKDLWFLEKPPSVVSVLPLAFESFVGCVARYSLKGCHWLTEVHGKCISIFMLLRTGNSYCRIS